MPHSSTPRLTLLLLAVVLFAGCAGGAATHIVLLPPYRRAHLASRADTVAFFAALTDTLTNSFGDTPQYLDPRITPLPPAFTSEGRLPSWLADTLLHFPFFSRLCEPEKNGYCSVESVGVAFSFSHLMRRQGSDTVIVDVDQGAVRPLPPTASPSWYGWGAQMRYYLVPELDRWLVIKADLLMIS